MEFTFETPGGKFKIDRTHKSLTPFGGLVAFASFLSTLGVIDKLVETCPVRRTSNNATPIRDIIVGFILTCIQEGKRFKHIRYVQHDAVIGKIFNVERRIPGEDTLRRFFESIDSDQGREWLYSVNDILYRSLSNPYILDWDSTVTTRYGEQEQVAIGYNPTKPGRGSHHPLVCSVAGLRLCLDLDFRSGDSASSSGWIAMMERLLSKLPSDKRPFLNRADVAFCSEEFLTWHESSVDRPRYLFKLRKTSRIREAISQVHENSWDGAASFGALQLSETRLKLHGWSCERRVILGRRLISKQSPEESCTLFGICQFEYYAWVTNLSQSQFTAFQIAELYQQRADCENIFDELKNQWGLSGFCSHQANATEIAARLTLLSYNLWSLFVRFFSGKVHQEAKTSRKDYLLHASQLVETARGRILQMAVNDDLWNKIREGYTRLQIWLKATAPQLELKSNWGKALVNTFPSQNSKILLLN
jgi:hypothetical protein